MTYRPTAKVQHLLAAMDREPARVWSVDDVAAVMELVPSLVRAHLAYAVHHQAVHRCKVRDRLFFARTAAALPQPVAEPIRRPWNPAADIRVPKFDPTWKPPVMQCARPTSTAHARAFAEASA
jgi:hypothetical protein